MILWEILFSFLGGNVLIQQVAKCEAWIKIPQPINNSLLTRLNNQGKFLDIIDIYLFQ